MAKRKREETKLEMLDLQNLRMYLKLEDIRAKKSGISNLDGAYRDYKKEMAK